MRSAAERSRRVLSHLGALLLAGLCLALCGCERSQAKPGTVSIPLVGARAELDRFAIERESRSVLRGKTHRFALSVPQNAELDIAFGVPGIGRAVKKWPSDVERVEFTVAFEHDGTRETLAEQRIARPPDGANQWHDLTVDLLPLAGRHGSLILEANAYPPTVFLQPTPAVINGVPVSIQRPPPVVWTTPRLRQPVAGAQTNLILVSIDTLRADHLGCYGYQRPTSPHVDRMAREGILFRNAVASSCWTLPSHASMFTGLDPTRHGAVAFFFVPMSYDLDTLAELLWDRGYETAGFVGGGFVADYFGLGQGFERFWENPAGKGEADTLQSIVDLAKPWMEQRRGAPFFLFLHTYQVHAPYTPSASALARFADPAYDGPYQTRFLENDARKLMKTRRFEPPILQHLNALYDGEILDMDTGVKDLLDFLRTSGLDRNTCVLFTSDHGEEFGEHGDIQHTNAKLYEELIHVPLIVWCPARFRGGRIVSDLASHTDILPTALELAGHAPPAGLDGTSLLPLLQGDEVPGRPIAISEVDGSTEKKQGTVRAVRGERYKLIESSIDGSQMLFDLPADPAETRDVRAALPNVARDLRLAAGAPHQPRAAAAAPAITPDDALRERLRALGYVE